MTHVPGPSERTMVGEAPKRLIVLRHGQTTHNAGGIWQGHLDTVLSQVGREQALASAEALADLEPTAIWSSDLRRASATAAALADRCGLPVHTDQRLREINVGHWQGKSSDDVRAAHGAELDAISSGEDIRRGEVGETVAEVRERATAAAEELIATLNPGELAVISTHGVAGRALVAGLVGIDDHTAWLALSALRNCHWAALVEGVHGWRIETWNAHA